MPNVSQKKIKLLELWKILLEKTDSSHSITLPQLLAELEAKGIVAERKSIYDDIETLSSFGVEICKRKTRTFEYYIEKRQFSLEELKLLSDSVYAFPPASRKEAEELTAKLSALCSVYQGKELEKRPVIVNTGKKPSERALANLELLHKAISTDCKVRFLPMEWRLSNSGKPEHITCKSGKAATISPWELIWTGEQYRLVAYDAHGEKARLLDLEQMSSLELVTCSREGKEAAELLNSGSKKEKIILEFNPALLERVIRRFGRDISVESAGKNKLRVTVKRELQKDFFVWLFSLGTDAKLISPKKAAEQFRERVKAAAKLYK